MCLECHQYWCPRVLWREGVRRPRRVKSRRHQHSVRTAGAHTERMHDVCRVRSSDGTHCRPSQGFRTGGRSGPVILPSLRYFRSGTDAMPILESLLIDPCPHQPSRTGRQQQQAVEG